MLRRPLVSAAALVLLLSCEPLCVAYEKEIRAMASTMADQVAKTSRRSIAVVDFTDLQGNVTELGRFIAEEFSVALAGAGKGFKVVDRTHLRAILQEHKLAATGVIDPATARKLGQITGVDALITGNITPFGDTVRLSVKVLDTASAEILTASTTDVPRTKAIEDLLRTAMQVPRGALAGAQIDGGRPSQQQGSPPAAQASALRKEAKQFTFELRSCKLSGDAVVCDLFITNNDQDRELVLNGLCDPPSRIFDESGNEYRANEVRLGSWSGNCPQGLVVSGVPTVSKLQFPKVKPDINRITLLEVGANTPRGYFTVQFRNVPVAR